jgi:hypothetical protein
MKRSPLLLLIVFLFGFLMSGVLTSCSPKTDGYAVLIWPEPTTPVGAGTILELSNPNDSEKTVFVTDGTTKWMTEQWRLIRFDKRDAAEAYSNAFLPWQDTYARSLRTALPVRERPDQASTRVYRLRDGELMKVLSRQDQMTEVGGLDDYWYEILTREGISGWVFGYHLELTGASGRALDPQEEHDTVDRIVRDIASVPWRPAYFQTMVSSGRINLNEFAPPFGLFGDWEDRTFRIVLPDLQRVFTYQGYQSSDGRTISFDGTDLQIVISAENKITAEYTVNGRRQTSDFQLFEDDISLIIEAERERREQLLQQFLDRGPNLISTAYGTMTISEDGRVSWNDFDRLVPNVIPAGFTGAGRLNFNIYPGDSLRGRYDGAVQLSGQDTAIPFLYSYTDDGVKFVFVPARNIDENRVIAAEPISPVVIFFRFVRG